MESTNIQSIPIMCRIINIVLSFLSKNRSILIKKIKVKNKIVPIFVFILNLYFVLSLKKCLILFNFVDHKMTEENSTMNSI